MWKQLTDKIATALVAGDLTDAINQLAAEYGVFETLKAVRTIKEANQEELNRLRQEGQRLYKLLDNEGGTRRDIVAYQEATRDPIFLLQKRVIVACERAMKDKDYDSDGMPKDSDEKLLAKGKAISYWDTEGVYYSREEAEKTAEAREYAYGKKGIDWQVYCLCAEGALANILKNPPQVQIEVKGGMVQEVIADKPVVVYLKDWDVEREGEEAETVELDVTFKSEVI